MPPITDAAGPLFDTINIIFHINEIHYNFLFLCIVCFEDLTMFLQCILLCVYCIYITDCFRIAQVMVRNMLVDSLRSLVLFSYIVYTDFLHPILKVIDTILNFFVTHMEEAFLIISRNSTLYQGGIKGEGAVLPLRPTERFSHQPLTQIPDS